MPQPKLLPTNSDYLHNLAVDLAVHGQVGILNPGGNSWTVLSGNGEPGWLVQGSLQQRVGWQPRTPSLFLPESELEELEPVSGEEIPSFQCVSFGSKQGSACLQH